MSTESYTIVNHVVEYRLVHGDGSWVTWPREIGTDEESARRGFEIALASKRNTGHNRVQYRVVKRTAVITDEVILEEEPEKQEKKGGGLFIDSDGNFYNPEAAAAHAVMVQGGYSTPLHEAARMIADGGESERRAREWMAEKGYTEGDLER